MWTRQVCRWSLASMLALGLCITHAGVEAKGKKSRAGAGKPRRPTPPPETVYAPEEPPEISPAQARVNAFIEQAQARGGTRTISSAYADNLCEPGNDGQIIVLPDRVVCANAAYKRDALTRFIEITRKGNVQHEEVVPRVESGKQLIVQYQFVDTSDGTPTLCLGNSPSE